MKIFGVLIVTTLTLVFSVASSPAQAANELGLSWDGQSWSATLSGSLFNSNTVWVPGDSESKSFYVRNQGRGAGTLRIAAKTGDGDRLFRNGDVRLAVRVSGGRWVALKKDGESLRINPTALPRGAARRVDVRASFVRSSPNRSQNKELALRFRVTMMDATAGAGGNGNGNGNGNGAGNGNGDGAGNGNGDGAGNGNGNGNGDGAGNGNGDGAGNGNGNGDGTSNGPLGDTGAPTVGWLIVFAGAALGTGLALMRRRHGEEEGRAGTSR